MPKSAAILKCLLKSSQNSEDTGLPQRATGPWPGTTHPWASRGLWHPRIVGKIFCSCVFLGRLIIVFIKHSEVSASQRIHLKVDCYKVELEVLQFLPQTVNKTCGSPRRFGIVQPARVPAEVLIDDARKADQVGALNHDSLEWQRYGVPGPDRQVQDSHYLGHLSLLCLLLLESQFVSCPLK